MLASFGACGTRKDRNSRSLLRQSSATSPQDAALLGVPNGDPKGEHTECMPGKLALHPLGVGVSVLGPLKRRRGAELRTGAVGEDCLSPDQLHRAGRVLGMLVCPHSRTCGWAYLRRVVWWRPRASKLVGDGAKSGSEAVGDSGATCIGATISDNETVLRRLGSGIFRNDWPPPRDFGGPPPVCRLNYWYMVSSDFVVNPKCTRTPYT